MCAVGAVWYWRGTNIKLKGENVAVLTCDPHLWCCRSADPLQTIHISLPLLPHRHSLSSLCVWRLLPTSYACSSSPSNGCSSPPVPMCGFSTSGIQVRPCRTREVWEWTPVCVCVYDGMERLRWNRVVCLCWPKSCQNQMSACASESSLGPVKPG